MAALYNSQLQRCEWYETSRDQYQHKINNCSVLEELHKCNRINNGAQNYHMLCLKAIQYKNYLKYNNQMCIYAFDYI